MSLFECSDTVQVANFDNRGMLPNTNDSEGDKDVRHISDK